jgi:hypothetical protein
LRLAPDLRFEVGGPIFGSAVDEDSFGDLDVVDVVDVVGLDCFGVVVVLAAGCNLAPGFAMEADLELMNPASVG